MYSKKKAVIPPNDKEFASLLNRFTSNIPVGYCGISEAELGPTRAAADEFNSSIIKAEDAVTSSKQATSEKQANRQTLEKIARPLIRRIKSHPDYTQALGFKLGLEGGIIAVQDLSSSTPSLTAINKTGGTVELRFVRRNSDGVNIYLQREQETEWTMVGRAMTTPFQDTRALSISGKPEIRRYTAVYMRGDKEVGPYNDDVIITCTP